MPVPSPGPPRLKPRREARPPSFPPGVIEEVLCGLFCHEEQPVLLFLEKHPEAHVLALPNQALGE